MTGALRQMLAGVALMLAVAAHAQTAPLRIVPVHDAPLASMVLLAAAGRAPVLLFDPQDLDPLRRALADGARPVECFVRSTTAPAARALLESTAGTTCTVATDLTELARQLWPDTRTAVLAPSASYPALLRGAALAGAAGAALVPVSAGSDPSAALRDWPLGELYVLPGLSAIEHPQARVIRIKKLAAAEQAALRRLPAPPRVLVVANPADRDGVFAAASLSLLAPAIATAARAPLILVGDAAADAVEAEVRRRINAHGLAPTHIYLVGDELALRSHRVPDPVIAAGGPEPIGGARDVRVELFSEIQHGRPQDYAVGRLVAEDAARASAILARQLGRPIAIGERVILLSNADEEFELGETIARTTAGDLRNSGLQVQAEYGTRITPAVIQDSLRTAGLLVWEGHARDLTLGERGSVAVQRTPPLVVLQGCYTLDRSDPFILFERGTEAIVATSAAIYSASGSSFARALMVDLLNGASDLGTAVRNARNYLLAVTELKKLRGHSDWPKTYRAALAFTLWGDPTAHPALPLRPAKLAPVQWRAGDAALELIIPRQRLKPARVGRYTAQPLPRAMMSGLLLRDGDTQQRYVKELFYDALPAPSGVTAACPPAPDWDVVSLFAPQTRTLSVLARPPGEAPSESPPAGTYRLPLVADASHCMPAPADPAAAADAAPPDAVPE